MAAFNKNGKVVSVNDAVSVIGKVVSVSGTGSLASVVVQAPLDSGTFNIQANDAYAVQQQPSILNAPDGTHAAVSIDGKNYGVAGDDLTILGVVTTISGSGVNAVLSVLLKTSQATITTAAGNVSSDNV